MQTLQSIFDACVTIYNHPKDWSPNGGLFWLTGLLVGWGIMTCVMAYLDHQGRAQK